MERPVTGDIFVIQFPYSDGRMIKRRPAYVAARLKGDDVIMCQISSRHRIDPYLVNIENNDFEEGALHKESYLRPNKIFTLDKTQILYKVGRLAQDKIRLIQAEIVKLFEPSF